MIDTDAPTDTAPPLSHTASYRARFDECGPDGTLRASGFMRWAQDCAWQHSERLGFTRDWYASRALWWLVRCAELNVLAEVRMGESVSVTTTIVGYRKVWARRRTEVLRMDGQRVATALTDWVITDSRGAPTRVPREFLELFGAGPTFTPGRVRLLASPPDADRRDITVRVADLDPMAHVNNAAYIDYLDESVIAAGQERLAAWAGTVPRRYRLEYVSAAGLGECLSAETWPLAQGVAQRLQSADGTEMLRATLDGLTAHDDFRQAVAARRSWHAPGKDAEAG